MALATRSWCSLSLPRQRASWGVLNAAFACAALYTSCASQPSPPKTATSQRLAAPTPHCAETGNALQVLGSGGPIADDARASSAYLVWLDGKARVLVDAGGGLLQRFGQSGAKLEDLDVIALSHLHADHSAGLPALLKSGYFSDRERPLLLVGPTAAGRFPSVTDFRSSLIGPEQGAFRYLASYEDGSHRFFELPVREVTANVGQHTVAFDNERLRVEAIGVKHGSVPALGFVLTLKRYGTRIGFAGDQAAGNVGFEQLARGVDLLVLHHPIPESARGLSELHARPSELGAMAKRTGARKVVLSHHMKRSLEVLEQGVKFVQAESGERPDVAEDLSCYPLN